MSRAKAGKAQGSDDIPSEVLKTEGVIQCLYKLFSKCFELGITPASWQNGIINPILKAGDSRYGMEGNLNAAL